MAPVLAYWSIRGLAQPARLMLNYVGEEFEDIKYECGDGPEFNKDSWFTVKANLGLDFPNLPYFVDGSIKISQSNAVLRYIARKHNLCGVTDEERAQVDMLADQVMDIRNAWVGLCYNPKFEERKAAYVEGLAAKFQAISIFLGNKKWLTGDNITFPDFHLYEMMDQHRIVLPGCLDQFKNLQQYIERFEALPAIKAYMASDKFMKSPINNKMAIGNN